MVLIFTKLEIFTMIKMWQKCLFWILLNSYVLMKRYKYIFNTLLCKNSN